MNIRFSKIYSWLFILAVLAHFAVMSQPSLVTRQLPEIILQTGHNQAVSAVVFAPDSIWLASGSLDNTVKIWDAVTGREIRNLSGHTGAVKSLTRSVDGRFLASGANDKTVRIWNIKSGEEIRSLPEHEGSVEAVAFSPNGKLLAAGSNRVIRIWDLESGRELYRFDEHLDWITALCFNADGTLLASGSADHTIKIWEITKGRKLQTLRGHADRVKVVSFSLDSRQIASGSFDKKVKLWSVVNGDEQFTLDRHKDKILALSYLPGGELRTASADGVIKTWDLKLKREISSIDFNGEGISTDELESAAFSADNSILAAGRGDRTVSLIDAKGGEKLQILENRTSGIYSTAFSPNDKWFAVGSKDNTIKLWDLQSGQGLPPLNEHTGYITNVVFHPDGRRLISASLDRQIKIWDVVAAKSIRTLNGHEGAVSAVTVTSDGKWIASGSTDKKIKIWDAESGSEARTLIGHSGEITSLAASPAENIIASASIDKTIRIWNVSGNGSPLILEIGSPVEVVVFSSDGRFLAAATESGAIKVWEVKDRKLLADLNGHSGKIHALAFGRDGKFLVSGGEDKTVRYWNIMTSKQHRATSEHSGAVFALSLAAGGKYLASGSEDGSVVLQDMEAGEKKMTLVSLRGGSDWLAIAPNGFFDGTPSSWSQIFWRFEGDTFKTAPVEVFFNEFFYPGLLKDVTENKSPTSARNFAEIDRRQPQIKFINEVNTQTAVASRSLSLKIEVTEAGSDRVNNLAAGNLRDIRLFRNGSLVKLWRGNTIDELAKLPDCAVSPSTPDQGRKIVCHTTINIVADFNNFTAYAFNRDNVKSNDAELVIRGAENLKREGTLYVLAIGIDEYADETKNLRYAVADIEAIGTEIAAAQAKLTERKYSRTEIIKLKNQYAAKENILAALRLFAGEPAFTGEPKTISRELSEQLEKIRPAQPEDALIIYFAGHGTASKESFYLILHDGFPVETSINDETRREKLYKFSISDVDLEHFLEAVDAGKILMVIDACNSGQALEAEEKRRGPMNSKGLAQLAYEKGMYILTASQSYQAALEVSRTPDGKKIEHGLLTYALLEGLSTSKADVNADRITVEREWFSFAVEEVPRMQMEEMQRRSAELKRGADSQNRSEIVFVNDDDKNLPPEKRGLQTPRLFHRREKSARPFVLANF
jgi:WD40 repeat protein